MMMEMPITIITPWSIDPVWQRTPWTCPRCGREYPGTPEVGQPCICGFRESD
jgi:hypothetical protein